MLVGRSKKCDVIIDDEKTSRKHAKIFFRHGEYFVRDLASRHGVYVNGVLAAGDYKLNDQDRITVGETDVMFFLDPEDMAKSIVKSYNAMSNSVVVIIALAVGVFSAIIARQLTLLLLG